MAQLAAAVAVKLPADKSDWIDGYFDVAESVPRDSDVRVAAPEIGAVGWRVWPAAILDMEGLVTPEAVGVAPETYLKLKRPDYLIVRTDNAAELLRALQRDEWFAQAYDVVSTRRDRLLRPRISGVQRERARSKLPSPCISYHLPPTT